MAGLLNAFGDGLRGGMERHFGALVFAFLALVAVGFVVALKAF